MRDSHRKQLRALEPVRHNRLHERVAYQLRSQILSGDYQPGERLPAERELTGALQVSRSSVRQALHVLELEGLVEVRVGSGGGAFVANLSLEPVLRSFTNLLALRGIEPSEFLAAKSIIEPTIFACAAETIRDEELQQLAENLAATRSSIKDGNDDLTLELSHKFHLIIAEATRNTILGLIISALVEVASSIPLLRGHPPGGWASVVRDHEEICLALTKRSVEDVRVVARRHAASVQEAFATSGQVESTVP